MAMLSLPRWARDAAEAWRGKPLLRLGERGIWIRDWETAGWIEWADIEAVLVDGFKEEGCLRLELRDQKKYLDRLDRVDRLSQTGSEVLRKVVTSIASKASALDNRSIALICRYSLDGQWDQLMAALDPMLAAHGIPKRMQIQLGHVAPANSSKRSPD
jgi:hypothetical protein